MAPPSAGGNRARVDLTLKLSLAGDPGVGKTSLTRRFVSNEYDERYIPTLGTKVSSREFAVNDPVRPGTPVAVGASVWDIMGNHQFRDLLKEAFFVNASGILLVFDVTRPDTLYNLPQWYEIVASVAGPVPTVVLANKSDLRAPSTIPREEIDRLCKELRWPWFETSAKTGENVETAFCSVAEEHLRTLERPKSQTLQAT